MPNKLERFQMLAREVFYTYSSQLERPLERALCELEWLEVQPQRQLAWQRLGLELPGRSSRYLILFLWSIRWS